MPYPERIVYIVSAHSAASPLGKWLLAHARQTYPDRRVVYQCTTPSQQQQQQQQQQQAVTRRALVTTRPADRDDEQCRNEDD